MKNNNQKRLKDLTTVQTGPFGSQLHMGDYVKNGTPIITVEHLIMDRISHKEDIPKVNTADTIRLKKFVLKEGDIVYSRVGSVDRSAYVSKKEDGWMFSGRLLRLRVTSSLVDPVWLYYYLVQENIKQYVRNIAVGATMPSLNTYLLGQIPVSLCPVTNQKKIAIVLSTIDSLIDNNEQRTQIIEKLLSLIYREWFVEFRFPGYEKIKFINSELGNIPSGWKQRQLKDISKRVKKTYDEDTDFSLPLLDLARINSESQIISEFGSSDELQTSRLIFDEDQILFGAVRPYFHKVILAPQKGITNTSVFVIGPKEDTHTSFLFSLLNSYESVEWATTYSSGTKMPVIAWEVFKNMKFILPPKDILDLYDQIAQPSQNLFKNLVLQNLRLTSLRNLLLPKLISGEIDISNLDIPIDN